MTRVLLLTFTMPMLARNMPSSPSRTVGAMRDRYRPLLIFAPAGNPQLGQQMRLLTSHRIDLVDRQLMLIPADRNDADAGDWEIMTPMGSEEPMLRKRFDIAPDKFTVVLLGKDGGEKFRSHKPVTIEQLNRIIDAMPMRRQEMKSRHTP